MTERLSTLIDPAVSDEGLEPAKVARVEGQQFDCATWLQKARAMPKEQFKREVEKDLTGREMEPHEII